MAFKSLLYALAIVACLACTVLLVREYLRTRIRLLLWSALCFVALSLNNIVLYVDLVLWIDGDLRLLRSGLALTGMGFLLYGFIWEAEA